MRHTMFQSMTPCVWTENQTFSSPQSCPNTHVIGCVGMHPKNLMYIYKEMHTQTLKCLRVWARTPEYPNIWVYIVASPCTHG